MFNKIITVSLNPALDLTVWVERIDFSEPVSATGEKYYPGGKAINVSRVLKSLGIETKLLGFTGDGNGKKLESLLKEENVGFDFISVGGMIRENLSIILPDEQIVKINRSGFSVSEDELELLKEKLIAECRGAKPLIVFAGSLPKGIGRERYKALILQMKSVGAEVVLDNDFFSTDDLRGISPFIIKPNQVELSHMKGEELETIPECIEFAKTLSPYVKHILVSLGGNGLLYVSKDKIIHASVPRVDVKSTVGAGDTTLSGFIYSLITDKPIEEATAFAASCGTASVTLDGTGIITKAEADSFLNRVILS